MVGCAQASLEFSLDFHHGEDENCLWELLASLPIVQTEELCTQAVICFLVAFVFLEAMDKEVPVM